MVPNNNKENLRNACSSLPLGEGGGRGPLSTAHRIFEVEALNDIFCTTEETTREFLSAIGHLYAQKPQSTRIYSLVITAMELGFKLGRTHGKVGKKSKF